MTSDYNERTNIAGIKQGFAVIGTLLGAGAAMPIMALFAGRTAGFIGMSAIFGFLAALSLLVTFLSVREPEKVEAPQKGSVLDGAQRRLHQQTFPDPADHLVPQLHRGGDHAIHADLLLQVRLPGRGGGDAGDDLPAGVHHGDAAAVGVAGKEAGQEAGVHPGDDA